MTSQKLKLRANSPKSKAIVFLHGQRVIARIQGPKGEVEVSGATLGLGPVTVHAVGIGQGDGATHVHAKPIQVGVTPPPALFPLRPLDSSSSNESVMLKRAGKRPVPIGRTTDANWRETHGIELNEEFELDGHLRIPEKGIYQFELGYQGRLELSMNDIVVHRLTNRSQRQFFYVPLALERGTYRVRVKSRIEGGPFHAAFGMRGTSSLNAPRFQAAR